MKNQDIIKKKRIKWNQDKKGKLKSIKNQGQGKRRSKIVNDKWKIIWKYIFKNE